MAVSLEALLLGSMMSPDCFGSMTSTDIKPWQCRTGMRLASVLLHRIDRSAAMYWIMTNITKPGCDWQGGCEFTYIAISNNLALFRHVVMLQDLHHWHTSLLALFLAVVGCRPSVKACSTMFRQGLLTSYVGPPPCTWLCKQSSLRAGASTHALILTPLRRRPVFPPAEEEEGSARECSVCLEEVTANANWTCFGCHHGTCTGCYEKLCQRPLHAARCPLCRAPLLEIVPRGTQQSQGGDPGPGSGAGGGITNAEGQASGGTQSGDTSHACTRIASRITPVLRTCHAAYHLHRVLHQSAVTTLIRCACLSSAPSSIHLTSL